MRIGIPNPMTRMNVKKQLFLLFLMMVCPVFVLNGYGNAMAESLLKRQVTSAYAELNRHNNALISRDIETVRKVSAAIVQNPQVQLLTASPEEPVSDRIKRYTDIDKMLSNQSIGVTGGEGVQFSLFVYDPRGDYAFAAKPDRPFMRRGVYFFGDADKPEWYDEAVDRKGSGYLRVIDFGGTRPPRTVAYLQAVNSIYQGNRTIGVIVATKMDKKIGESLEIVSLPDRAEVYFTDWSNRVLGSTLPAIDKVLELPHEVRTGFQSEGTMNVIATNWIYVMTYNEIMGQKLVYRIPVESLLKQQNELKRIILFISVAYFLVTFVVMVYFWRSLLTPLERVAVFVRRYEPGKLVPKTPGQGRNDEVGVLIAAVYDMANRLNVLVHDKYMMDIREKEAQLQLLYQQINPHLLYNTLESIYWKSALEGQSETAEMIKELSKLMKIGLSRGRELISLEEELEHARAYTVLQQKRYDYGFRVEWRIGERTGGVLVPKITLQPLIENAIIHGVKNMGDDGELVVAARLEGGSAIITVEDNGYKPVDLDAIDRLLNAERGDPSVGYGIRNVHQRIRLHFGEPYGLSYARRDGGGTIATIVVPAVAVPDAGTEAGHPSA